MSNGEHQESVLEARGLVKRYPEGRGELQFYREPWWGDWWHLGTCV